MPPKGKQGTKGQKQIVEDNKQTLRFYLYIVAGVNALYLVVQYLFFWDDFTTLPMFMLAVVLVTYLGSYHFMSSMARPTYDSTGHLLDGGIDLNMEQGMAEHLKDLILLAAIVQALSLFTNYFWLFLLLAPGRALYMLWVNILAPWFFAPPPEVDEKKVKKQDRKMRRH